jgi:hypothetical protein
MLSVRRLPEIKTTIASEDDVSGSLSFDINRVGGTSTADSIQLASGFTEGKYAPGRWNASSAMKQQARYLSP